MVNRELLLLTYFGEEHEDPHAVYSQRLGTPRQEAKKIFYSYMYTQPFWRGMCDHHSRVKEQVLALYEEIR